jgi:hypothetical protein
MEDKENTQDSMDLNEDSDIESVDESSVQDTESIGEVNTMTSYKYNGEIYIVDTDPFLQKNFDNVDPEINYTMNICIYKCVRNGCTPYLLYLMIHDIETNTIVLPNYKTTSGGGGEPVEETENRILEDFKTRLFNIFPPEIYEKTEETADIYNEDFFRGFYIDTKSESITFVYDSTRANVPLATDKPYFWVTPYEMFVSKNINEIPIDEHVIREISSSLNGTLDKRFFHLTQMSDNSLVKDPYILFLCKKEESFLGGMVGTDFTIENVTEPLSNDTTINLIFPRINHPLIGNYTFFSSLPSTPGLKRYVVFVDIDGLNPLYIENKDISLLDQLYSPENTNHYSAITFMHNLQVPIQVWCIKSPLHFSLL